MAAKKTPLHSIYSDARLIEYAGWELPLQFAGISREHREVRTRAGLFDVSHMGEITVTGRDSLSFLQYVAANDCSRLIPGRIVYTPICYPDGGCVDDLLIYMLDEHEFLLVVNAANTGKDLAWLMANSGGYSVKIEDISPTYAQLALQGPLSPDILGRLAGPEITTLPYYSFLPRVELAGCYCMISRTGYTGEDGFEIYAPAESAAKIWQTILANGEAVPAGLGARDTLRIEASLPLYGHEISPSISPIEGGLARFIALGKKEFIGAGALAAQAETGTGRTLIGIELCARGVPRAEYPVKSAGVPVGWITSGTLSPYSNRPIGMALVASGEKLADSLAVEIRGRDCPARRVPLPFYKRRRA